jgi:hypothetical protein
VNGLNLGSPTFHVEATEHPNHHQSGEVPKYFCCNINPNRVLNLVRVRVRVRIRIRIRIRVRVRVRVRIRIRIMYLGAHH